MIPDKTIPFVFVHFEMAEHMYDLKLFADLRKFFFKPEVERQVYEKLRSYFLAEFNRLCPKYSADDLEQKRLSENDLVSGDDDDYYDDQRKNLQDVSNKKQQLEEITLSNKGSEMLLQIEQAKGKMKKFIKKKIKFRKYPHKRGVNVYILDDGTGNIIKNETAEGQEIEDDSVEEDSDEMSD